jgi:hypothetical protein
MTSIPSVLIYALSGALSISLYIDFRKTPIMEAYLFLTNTESAAHEDVGTVFSLLYDDFLDQSVVSRSQTFMVSHDSPALTLTAFFIVSNACSMGVPSLNNCDCSLGIILPSRISLYPSNVPTKRYLKYALL